MTTSPRLLLAILLAATLTGPIAVYACTCIKELFSEKMKRCDLVFRGTPVRYERPGPVTFMVDGKPRTLDPAPGPVRWYFVPTALWKGAVSDTIVVYAPWYGSECGVQFPLGNECLVFAYRSPMAPWYWGHWPAGAESVASLTTMCDGSGIRGEFPELGPPVWERGEPH